MVDLVVGKKYYVGLESEAEAAEGDIAAIYMGRTYIQNQYIELFRSPTRDQWLVQWRYAVEIPGSERVVTTLSEKDVMTVSEFNKVANKLRVNKQYTFADGTPVTEEAKKGKFKLIESYCIFRKGEIVEYIKGLSPHEGHFRNDYHESPIGWSSLLPLKEPEYIKFTQETFVLGTVVEYFEHDSEFMITAKNAKSVWLINEWISYAALFQVYQIVNPDGTRTPCGLEVVK